jgi:LysM repeat protein
MNRPLAAFTLALVVVPSLAFAEELDRQLMGDIREMSVPTLALPASGEWLPADLVSLDGVGFPEVAESGVAPELVGRIRYEVASGDTLSEIAEEYDVSVEDILRWNGLDSDRLSIGQVLTIRTSGSSSSSSSSERERSTYTVRSGDTATTIARRNGFTLAELQRWNRRANLDRLRIGQELVIYVEASGSGSTGSPNRGRLRGGVQLEEGTGYRVRNPERAFGTPATVAAIRNGIARLVARYVEVPDVLIHDLSFARGGRMTPHASHQNGLDADVTYYRVGVEDLCGWQSVEPHELDVRLQWYLFRTWIEQGVVEYLFVDYDLQEPMYEYARERGATDEQLGEWFEYPNRGGGRAIIRHESGHADHFHVRFRNVASE